MKVWVFVEGESDRIALNTLWERWRDAMGKTGWGIHIIPLDDKPRYFRKIGHRAAEKLVREDRDLVVGLPDLYPNKEYTNTEYKHEDLIELKAVQTKLVKKALIDYFDIPSTKTDKMLIRFYPAVLKHDLEMLLLAAHNELRDVLGTTDSLGNWYHPVEDQNQQKPPKYIIEDLFRKIKRRQYRETIHPKAVFEKVADIKNLFFNASGQIECPVFKELMDWIGKKTEVPGY